MRSRLLQRLLLRGNRAPQVRDHVLELDDACFGYLALLTHTTDVVVQTQLRVFVSGSLGVQCHLAFLQPLFTLLNLLTQRADLVCVPCGSLRRPFLLSTASPLVVVLQRGRLQLVGLSQHFLRDPQRARRGRVLRGNVGLRCLRSDHAHRMGCVHHDLVVTSPQFDLVTRRSRLTTIAPRLGV